MLIAQKRLPRMSAGVRGKSIVELYSAMADCIGVLSVEDVNHRTNKRYNTKAVVLVSQSPSGNELDEIRSVFYNRLSIQQVFNLSGIHTDDGNVITGDQNYEHPISTSEILKILNGKYQCDFNPEDIKVTFINGNNYTIEAKVNSIGYTGAAHLGVGVYIEVPKVPTENALINAPVTAVGQPLTVNERPITLEPVSLFEDEGIIFKEFNVGNNNKLSYFLNTKNVDLSLSYQLATDAIVNNNNLNETIVGGQTPSFILSAFIDAQLNNTITPIVTKSGFEFATWLLNPAAFDAVFHTLVNDTPTTLTELLTDVNPNVKASFVTGLNGENNVVRIDNKLGQVSNISFIGKTLSLPAKVNDAYRFINQRPSDDPQPTYALNFETGFVDEVDFQRWTTSGTAPQIVMQNGSNQMLTDGRKFVRRQINLTANFKLALTVTFTDLDNGNYSTNILQYGTDSSDNTGRDGFAISVHGNGSGHPNTQMIIRDPSYHEPMVGLQNNVPYRIEVIGASGKITFKVNGQVISSFTPYANLNGTRQLVIGTNGSGWYADKPYYIDNVQISTGYSLPVVPVAPVLSSGYEKYGYQLSAKQTNLPAFMVTHAIPSDATYAALIAKLGLTVGAPTSFSNNEFTNVNANFDNAALYKQYLTVNDTTKTLLGDFDKIAARMIDCFSIPLVVWNTLQSIGLNTKFGVLSRQQLGDGKVFKDYSIDLTINALTSIGVIDSTNDVFVFAFPVNHPVELKTNIVLLANTISTILKPLNHELVTSFVVRGSDYLDVIEITDAIYSRMKVKIPSIVDQFGNAPQSTTPLYNGMSISGSNSANVSVATQFSKALTADDVTAGKIECSLMIGLSIPKYMLDLIKNINSDLAVGVNYTTLLINSFIESIQTNITNVQTLETLYVDDVLGCIIIPMRVTRTLSLAGDDGVTKPHFATINEVLQLTNNDEDENQVSFDLDGEFGSIFNLQSFSVGFDWKLNLSAPQFASPTVGFEQTVDYSALIVQNYIKARFDATYPAGSTYLYNAAATRFVAEITASTLKVNLARLESSETNDLPLVVGVLLDLNISDKIKDAIVANGSALWINGVKLSGQQLVDALFVNNGRYNLAVFIDVATVGTHPINIVFDLDDTNLYYIVKNNTINVVSQYIEPPQKVTLLTDIGATDASNAALADLTPAAFVGNPVLDAESPYVVGTAPKTVVTSLDVTVDPDDGMHHVTGDFEIASADNASIPAKLVPRMLSGSINQYRSRGQDTLTQSIHRHMRYGVDAPLDQAYQTDSVTIWLANGSLIVNLDMSRQFKVGSKSTVRLFSAETGDAIPSTEQVFVYTTNEGVGQLGTVVMYQTVAAQDFIVKVFNDAGDLIYTCPYVFTNDGFLETIGGNSFTFFNRRIDSTLWSAWLDQPQLETNGDAILGYKNLPRITFFHSFPVLQGDENGNLIESSYSFSLRILTSQGISKPFGIKSNVVHLVTNVPDEGQLSDSYLASPDRATEFVLSPAGDANPQLLQIGDILEVTMDASQGEGVPLIYKVKVTDRLLNSGHFGLGYNSGIMPLKPVVPAATHTTVGVEFRLFLDPDVVSQIDLNGAGALEVVGSITSVYGNKSIILTRGLIKNQSYLKDGDLYMFLVFKSNLMADDYRVEIDWDGLGSPDGYYLNGLDHNYFYRQHHEFSLELNQIGEAPEVSTVRGQPIIANRDVMLLVDNEDVSLEITPIDVVGDGYDPEAGVEPLAASYEVAYPERSASYWLPELSVNLTMLVPTEADTYTNTLRGSIGFSGFVDSGMM